MEVIPVFQICLLNGNISHISVIKKVVIKVILKLEFGMVKFILDCSCVCVKMKVGSGCWLSLIGTGRINIAELQLWKKCV